MRIVIVIALGAGLVIGCGGTQKAAPQDPQVEVQQMIRLYKENRSKFVQQKQRLSSGENCARATRLRQAIDAVAEEAAMSPENTDDITMVQMELTQAEKDCLAR